MCGAVQREGNMQDYIKDRICTLRFVEAQIEKWTTYRQHEPLIGAGLRRTKLPRSIASHASIPLNRTRCRIPYAKFDKGFT